MRSNYVNDQILGAVVQATNDVRDKACELALDKQDEILAAALKHVDGARAFLEDPSNILGSEGTKHGEVAEVIEVAIRNAKSVIYGADPVATFDGTARTGAVDFFINGVGYQSKFYNNDTNGLKALVDYLEKYPDLAKSSGLIIPSDRYEKILTLLGDGSDKNKALKEAVAKIEELTGKPFTEAVSPSISTYAEVQLGAVDQTIDMHETEIENINDDIKDEIRTEHGPSISGGIEAAGLAGAIGGSICLGMELYNKAKDGRNVFRGELTRADWKDVGIAGVKGFGTGAVTGGALYVLTNYAEMSAPLASAMVSAIKGLYSLTDDYASGKISQDEFVSMGMCVCAESAIVGIATVAGQTIIPIPVLGGIIGSVAGRMMLGLVSGLDSEDKKRIEKEMDEFIKALDEQYHSTIEKLNAEFDKLGKLTDAAFNFELNYRLVLLASVDLAIAHGVPQDKILSSVSDVDIFMLN